MLDEWAHEAEQQREQQGRNVLPVDVGVGHQHDLVIAQLCDVELFVDARAERVMIDWTSAFFSTRRCVPSRH